MSESAIYSGELPGTLGLFEFRAVDKDGNALYSLHHMNGSHSYQLLPWNAVMDPSSLRDHTRIASWPDAGVGGYVECGPKPPLSAARWRWLQRNCSSCHKPPRGWKSRAGSPPPP